MVKFWIGTGYMIQMLDLNQTLFQNSRSARDMKPKFWIDKRHSV